MNLILSENESRIKKINLSLQAVLFRRDIKEYTCTYTANENIKV